MSEIAIEIVTITKTGDETARATGLMKGRETVIEIAMANGIGSEVGVLIDVVETSDIATDAKEATIEMVREDVPLYRLIAISLGGSSIMNVNLAGPTGLVTGDVTPYIIEQSNFEDHYGAVSNASSYPSFTPPVCTQVANGMPNAPKDLEKVMISTTAGIAIAWKIQYSVPPILFLLLTLKRLAMRRSGPDRCAIIVNFISALRFLHCYPTHSRDGAALLAHCVKASRSVSRSAVSISTFPNTSSCPFSS